MTQDDYNNKYGELMNRYERTKEKHENLSKMRSDKKSHSISLKFFFTNLKNADDKLLEWNEHVLMLSVKSAIVHRDKSITFKLNNIKEIKS